MENKRFRKVLLFLAVIITATVLIYAALEKTGGTGCLSGSCGSCF